MATLLRIDSSPMGEGSISRDLTAEFARSWQTANPDGRVISRDLTTMWIPAVASDWVAAHYTPAESRTPEHHALLARSTELARELLDADEYVMGIPTHNWGAPASFKLWVDHFTSPFGLRLDGKRATFIITAGRSYGPGSGNGAKRQVEPWLRTLFRGFGVADMHFVFVDATVQVFKGEVERAAFLGPHIDAIHALIAGEAVASG
ncbi:MAG TPA: NAD(P)H-dependent oxidoreductase [Candidatus Acidoferrales bacterium]|jgi:FMN-dependent NADH-azoreductase|nr:NAD(P)H-dependent oxidoreductase [Candidatus Acidoferrales bacterium]